MPEEVYNYLTEYGFSNEELDNFQEENDKMFFVSTDIVKNNISFLEGLGLNKEDIINVFRLNPFMITVGNNRITALNKIYYEVLGFTSDDIKSLILKNADLYTASPIELEKNINYLKDKKCNIDMIKKFIMDNPKVVNAYLDEFKKMVSFKY